jgi:uncharacterized protein YyaL (SSP411 family)
MRTVRVKPLVLVLLATCSAAAGERAQVAWQTDLASAWSATRQYNRPLLVFVTHDDCAYCTQMKDRTYGDAALAGAINRSFVPLVLDGGTKSPLLAELHVRVFPSTFVISPQAVVLARVDGYLPPEAMARRLNALGPMLGVAARADGR